MDKPELFSLIEQKTRRTRQWEDVNYLADLLTELASLYATLGTVVAEARRDRDDADTVLKVEREKIKLRLLDEGSTATKADSRKIVDTEDLAKQYNGLNYRYELIRSYRENLEKTIDAIRSRISYSKYEASASQA